MRHLLLIPIVIAIAASAYGAVAFAAGYQMHPRELIAAALVGCVAGDLALVPIILLRKSDTATLSQGALGGTVIHMFLTILLAAGVSAAKLIGDRKLFMFMLLAFYWVSLVVVVLVMARFIRGAAAAQRHTMAPTK